MHFDLREDEEIKSLNRKHSITYGAQILASLFLVVAPFFFMVPLWRLEKWGYIIFGFLVGLGIIFFLRVLISWYSNVLVITDERLIVVERKGFFQKKISKIGYEQIRAVEVSIKGIFQTLFKCGSLHIRLIESPNVIELANLSRPTKIQELILRLKGEFQKESKIDQMGYSRLLEMARQLRDKLGRDKFKEIVEE